MNGLTLLGLLSMLWIAQSLLRADGVLSRLLASTDAGRGLPTHEAPAPSRQPQRYEGSA